MFSEIVIISLIIVTVYLVVRVLRRKDVIHNESQSREENITPDRPNDHDYWELFANEYDPLKRLASNLNSFPSGTVMIAVYCREIDYIGVGKEARDVFCGNYPYIATDRKERKLHKGAVRIIESPSKVLDIFDVPADVRNSCHAAVIFNVPTEVLFETTLEKFRILDAARKTISNLPYELTPNAFLSKYCIGMIRLRLPRKSASESTSIENFLISGVADDGVEMFDPRWCLNFYFPGVLAAARKQWNELQVVGESTVQDTTVVRLDSQDIENISAAFVRALQKVQENSDDDEHIALRK